ncbi:UDP-N-acetylmuramoyl-L-alanine--D-glutamate ligase [Verticiella sediminum]|uniref:UDP-N-acetylmuramoylalanine--D-glutamate ligase n=1 Tax=Verticiella sediminum TaxID=1247510 RepID=A0A556A8D7_9BURK|nr:UDP-N-acetylmuramoyl-L-alanine--D-glutamate ligase [Verticiella sediminum]TSH89135.1 UDP-N-acetylmuramoyl-L-alanine--D-glutamate ligase [Verticiella sediminum]
MEQPHAPLAAPPCRTLVLGLGETGLAAARWCARQGWPVRVADTREEPPALARARELLPQAELRLGLAAFGEALTQGIDCVVLSPGLAPNALAVAPLLQAARAAGIEVIGEVELFARALPTLREDTGYAPAVLAVTGTNGKTTVTSLTASLIAGAGLRAKAAGNIGPAALDALMAALDAGDLPDVWVLELSSFQLDSLSSLAPHAATVLNVSEDHLDWHGDLATYAKAKARILRNAGLLVVNRDDACVLDMVERLDLPNVRSFGVEAPQLAGDLGIENDFGMAWLAEAAHDEFGSEPAIKRRKGDPPPARGEGRLNRLMPADALQIRGRHNALNAQAALLLARSLGLSWGPLLRALREYRGEPHRVEFVRSVGGVDFIDDSKGTNVGATLAALQGLGTKVVLIAGGDGKGQDFSPLAPAVAAHARAVVLIGRDAQRLQQALADTGVACLIEVDGLPAAVERALGLAQVGDAVLLSPACASLDMFRNYVHRAQVFADTVHELALARGEA